MITLRTFFVACLITYSITATSQSTYVLCATDSGETWYWLLDQSGRHYVSVTGFRTTYLDGEHKNYRFFSIDEQIYFTIKNECLSGYNAQPADDSTSSWSVFMVNQKNGGSYKAPGRQEKVSFRNCFLSPIQCVISH